MSDRELLELAAKAAGIDVVRSRLDDPLIRDFLVNASARNPYQVSSAWNPLADDGDALRLAVKLNINITARRDTQNYKNDTTRMDPYAATRRAIVRAAAEIGRSKE